MIQLFKYGSPVLRIKAGPVESIDKGVRKLADALLELMMQKNGLGLAAQQVGKIIRIFAMYVPPQYDLIAYPPQCTALGAAYPSSASLPETTRVGQGDHPPGPARLCLPTSKRVATGQPACNAMRPPAALCAAFRAGSIAGRGAWPGSSAGEPDGKRLNPEINEPIVMLNPVLLSRTGTQNEKEGCLSIPDIFAPVRRAYEVSVSFLDLHGRQQQVKVKGLMARVVQHEIDHLDGILFVDRISAIKKISLAAKLRKLKRATEREISAD